MNTTSLVGIKKSIKFVLSLSDPGSPSGWIPPPNAFKNETIYTRSINNNEVDQFEQNFQIRLYNLAGMNRQFSICYRVNLGLNISNILMAVSDIYLNV